MTTNTRYRRLGFERLEQRALLSASPTYGASGAIGPQPGVSAPPGAIVFTPSMSHTAIEMAVAKAPAGSTFYFEAGTYKDVSIAPLTGDTFIGAYGAMLTSKKQPEAFFSGNPNVTIENLAISGYAPKWPFSTIQAGAQGALTTGWTISNVSVSGSTGQGVQLFDGDKLLNSNISGNLYSGVKVDGFVGYPGTHPATACVLVQNCIIDDNNPRGNSDTTFGAGGLKVWYNDAPVSIIDCTISGNTGNGVWFDTSIAGGVVSGCLIQNNNGTQAWGVYSEVSNYVTVQNNYISGNGMSHSNDSWPSGGGIEVEDGTGCLVSGNVVYLNGNAIVTASDPRTDEGIYWQLLGTVISNNTVTMSQGHNGSYWSDSNGGTSQNVAWVGNVYSVTGSATFVWNNWQNISVTLGQWHALGLQ